MNGLMYAFLLKNELHIPTQAALPHHKLQSVNAMFGIFGKMVIDFTNQIFVNTLRLMVEFR